MVLGKHHSSDHWPLFGPTVMTMALLVPFNPAQAQQAKNSDDARLEEVIVTAERVSANLQDVPVAVTAITGEQLQERGFHDPSQLRFLAPSLQANPVSQTPSNADFSIRGVGTTSFSNSIEYNVSTVIDDVVLARPELGVVQYFDVDQVEVLRGPQVTLFGKNASAGVVSIRSKRPKIGAFEGTVRLESTYADLPSSAVSGRLEGVINAPVSDDSALRISAFGIDQAALVENVLPGNKTNADFVEGGLKAKYLWEATDELYVYLIGDYAKERGAGQHAFTLRSVGNGAAYPTVLADSLAASGIVPSPENQQLNADGKYDTHYETGGAQMEVGMNLDNGFSLTNIVAWRYARMVNDGDSDTTAVDYFNSVALDLADHQWSEELRISSPEGKRVRGQAGIYLLKGEFERNTFASGKFGRTAPPGFVFRGGESYSTQYADSAAVFTQFTVNASPQFRLIAGGRLTYDDIELKTRSLLGNALTPFFPVGTLTQTRTHTNFSYKLGAQYDIGSASMAYLTYTRGYKGPAFNNTASATAAIAVDPEIPTSWEIGLKSALLDHRLTLNMAAFTTSFRDFQTNSVDPVTLLTVLQNAGTAKTRGIEAEVVAKAGPHLTISGGLAYIDADYQSFLNSPCYTGQTVAAGCRIVRPASSGVPAVTAYDASGQPLGNAPKFTSSLRLAYERDLNDDLEGFMALGGYYRTKANYSNNGTPGTYHQGFSPNSFRTVGVQGELKF